MIERLLYYSEYGITEFAKRCNLSCASDLYKIIQAEDCRVGTLYKICKAEGYQIICFNPKTKESYLINSEVDPLKVKDPNAIRARRQYPNHYVEGEFVRDIYTGEKVKKPYRPKRSYKKRYRKQVQFVNVSKEIKNDENDR